MGKYEVEVKCKTCVVCGHEFRPHKSIHYISCDNRETGLVTLGRHVEEDMYDTFDCPHCGCQNVVQKRKRTLLSKCLAEAKKTNEDVDEDDGAEDEEDCDRSGAEHL